MAVEPLETYKTPWEARGEEYDPVKGKKFVHWLLGKIDTEEAARKTVETERDGFKQKVDEFTRKDESAADKQARESKELQDRIVANENAARDAKQLRLDIALDFEGISGKDAKFMADRLTGTTREEIEADARIFVERYITPSTKKDDDDDDDNRREGPNVRTSSTLRTHGDPNPGSGAKEMTYDEAMAAIPRLVF